MAAGATTGNCGSRRCVIEGGRRPGGRGTMAGIALGGRADVGDRFGLGVLGQENPAVAGRALARHARMVHRGWRPGDETADVAGIALCRGRNVHVGLRLRIGKIIGTAMAA
ncbi:hypothetical protein SCD_n00972 [Sulfuricella denitrificans skB26]|uniref:Uncharacterized protein n=1 Tax=Sulfuricella denitrificans (strain DSM 22764 / NBRC 105220 / skB26) TaxID=1163617 RepID=S6B2C4_SULDS|nr:hypothetical protein SCD_n00972 [Sulfuricella denitrificans skB26]